MSWTFSNVVDVSNQSGTSIGLTLTAVPYGATIIFEVNTGSTVSGSASDGVTYTQVGTSISSSGQQTSIWRLQTALAGTHSISVPLTAGGFSNYCAAAWFLNGAATFNVTSQNDSSFVGTGANVITSNAATTTINSSLILGIVRNVSGGGTLSAGTSPNAFTAISGVTSASSLWEQFVQTTAGSIAATAGTTSSGDNQTFMIALSPGASTSSQGGFFW